MQTANRTLTEMGNCMSTYVISDIHGCFDELQDALELVNLTGDDRLYILGDLVDRGPKIAECIDWLVSERANEDGSGIRFLLGNHEEMALWAFDGPWSSFEFDDVMLNPWLRNGGGETIRQLETLDPKTVDAFERIVRTADRAKAISVNGEVVLMCHAGIRPAEPESEDAEWLIQSAEDLLWIGSEWYCADEQPPFHVVSGHVPVLALASSIRESSSTNEAIISGLDWRMMHWGRKHDIDCGCVYGGRLGILKLQDWSEHYIDSSTTR